MGCGKCCWMKVNEQVHTSALLHGQCPCGSPFFQGSDALPAVPSLPRWCNHKPKGSQNFPKSCSIPERKEARSETKLANICSSGFWFALLSGLFLQNLTRLAEVEIEACLKWVNLFLGLLTVLRIEFSSETPELWPEDLLGLKILDLMVTVERGLGRSCEGAVSRKFKVICSSSTGALKEGESWEGPLLLRCREPCQAGWSQSCCRARQDWSWIYGNWEFSACSALCWHLGTWGTLLQSNLDILGPLFYEILASFYEVLVPFYKIHLKQVPFYY